MVRASGIGKLIVLPQRTSPGQSSLRLFEEKPEFRDQGLKTITEHTSKELQK